MRPDRLYERNSFTSRVQSYPSWRLKSRYLLIVTVLPPRKLLAPPKRSLVVKQKLVTTAAPPASVSDYVQESAHRSTLWGQGRVHWVRAGLEKGMIKTPRPSDRTRP